MRFRSFLLVGALALWGPARAEVVFNEIHYHPFADEDELYEFVELVNTGDTAVDLQGYSFANGLEFRFEESWLLAPGEMVVVCRNRDALVETFGIANAVGNFSGQLSNGGERLTLQDPAGRAVDTLRYSDEGDWPVAPDGLGPSLEKIVPEAPSDSPASWSPSRPGSAWRHQRLLGGATSNTVVFFLEEPGEFLIDNVSLVAVAAPETPLLRNGTFDTGTDGWTAAGTHEASGWSNAGGAPGGGLRLQADGAGAGTANAVSALSVTELDTSGETRYLLEFDYRHLSGSTRLGVQLSRSSLTRGLFWRLGEGTLASPGTANNARQDTLPPFVSELGRTPREPTSADTIWITAHVESATEPTVELEYAVAAGDAVRLTMRDDGASSDGDAGDNVYGAGIPPQAHSSVVTFRIHARTTTGETRVSPLDSDPTGVHAFYVNDNQPESKLPIYHLIVRPETGFTPQAILTRLSCANYLDGSFAYRGDVYHNVGFRARGNSVCSFRKRYMKIRFQRGRDFEGRHKLNLQSLWTDKSLIREHLSWDLFEGLGSPYCTHEYVRIHVNGEYYGLYAALEHPDKRYLARNRLDDSGNLYKAENSREEVGGLYEKETNEGTSFEDLRDFLATLNQTPAAELAAFFSARTDVDNIIDYQTAQTLASNLDYLAKNHLLYHDPGTDKWSLLAWDVDLTFGKAANRGVLTDTPRNPGQTPWFGTRVDGAGAGNVLLNKFFFEAGAAFRRAYRIRLLDAFREKYTSAVYDEKIAALRELLFEEQAEDIAAWGRSPPLGDPDAPEEFLPNLVRVKTHILSRIDFLSGYFSTSNRELPPEQRFLDHPRLKITEVMYRPASHGDDEYLELWNPTDGEIGISGWTIEGLGAAPGERFTFPEGSRVAAGEVFLVAKAPARLTASNPALSAQVFGPYPGRLSNSGEALRLRDVGPGHPATIDWLRYEDDSPWPEGADGDGFSLELTDVAPYRDNDLPQNWQRSRESGGSPGRIEGLDGAMHFLKRGDCSGDGAVNLVDAIAIVRLLFAREDVPCAMACELDGAESLSIADALLLLNVLFGQSDGASPPLGDCRPTTDMACDAASCAE